MKRLLALSLVAVVALGGWTPTVSGGAEATKERWRIREVRKRGQHISFSVFKDGEWQGRLRFDFQDGGSFPDNYVVTVTQP